VILLLLLCLQDAPRFAVYDVTIETDGKPLAAWQLEVTSAGKLVGVEGFPKPPYFDPAALEGGRIVLAGFSTDAAPTGRVRVARLHFFEERAADPASKLIVAAAPGGGRIDAKITLVRLGEKK
jgi:hypothetical protein